MRSSILLCLSMLNLELAAQLPQGFTYLDEIAPDITVELRYSTVQNFMGKKVDAYSSGRCIITREAANALQQVNEELRSKGFALKIFDAYRPQTAVNHFVRWAQDLTDTLNKSEYYPKVPKNELFQRGYIAARSGHSRGSTVDLTIISIQGEQKGKELDMGTSWDFFGKASWPTSTEVSEQQQENRWLLRETMIKYGFKPYEAEWWHFTLENEPFPDTYFDFEVK